MECEPVPEVKETSGGLGSSVAGALWQGYERIKDNSYVQSGLEKSISTVSYITPGIAQDYIKQYYSNASTTFSNIYTNPKDSLSSSKEYIGGSLSSSKEYIGGSLSSSKEYIGGSLSNSKEYIGESLSNSKEYIGERLSDGKGYIGIKLTNGTELLSGARDRVGTKVGAGTEYVKEKLASNSEYVQSTRIGQVVRSGMDKGLTAADGVIDYLMPGEEAQQEPREEEGVWGHGKEVSYKAKDRLTSLVANKYSQTGDYISSKYSKSRENISSVKDYAYEVTAAKGHNISQRFQTGRDYVQTISMFQRMSNNFGEAVVSAEEILEKLVPERASSPEASEEIERGSIEHVMKLTRRIQRRLMGKLKIASAMLPSVPGPGLMPEAIWEKIPQMVDRLPLPKILKEHIPQYFPKESDQGKVEDKTPNSF